MPMDSLSEASIPVALIRKTEDDSPEVRLLGRYALSQHLKNAIGAVELSGYITTQQTSAGCWPMWEASFSCTVPGLDEWTENAKKLTAGPEGRRVVDAIAEHVGEGACCEWAQASLNEDDKDCPDYCRWPIKTTRECSSERKGKDTFGGTASKELWCTTGAFEGTEWEPNTDDPFYGVTTKRTARSPVVVWAPGSDTPLPVYPFPPTGHGRRRLRHPTYSLHTWMTPDSIRARLTRLWRRVALDVDGEVSPGVALPSAPTASAAKGHTGARSSSPATGTSEGMLRAGPSEEQPY